MGRAEAPGGVGAPRLRPRVYGGLSQWRRRDPGLRVRTWNLRPEQVSAAAGASPSAAVSAGVVRSFPISQKETPRRHAHCALGVYFRGCFFCQLSFLSSDWAEGRLLRMCDRARDGRANRRDKDFQLLVALPGAGASQPALRRLAFLICEMKSPVALASLTAETLTALRILVTLCLVPGAPVTLGRLLPVSATQFPTSKWRHDVPRAPTWPSCWKKRRCVFTEWGQAGSGLLALERAGLEGGHGVGVWSQISRGGFLMFGELWSGVITVWLLVYAFPSSKVPVLGSLP